MALTRPLTFLALATLAVASCNKPKPADAAVDPLAGDSTKTGNIALPVVGEPVRKGDLILTVTAKGEIQSEATSMLKAEASGTVMSVMVRPGDKVTRGQVIIRLDSVPLLLDMRSAIANMNTAQVNYRNVIEPDSAAGRMPTEARRAYARSQTGVENAQINLDKAKLALEHVAVVAPFDGVIQSVAITAGDHINAGGDVAKIVDMTNLRVEAQVLEHDLPLLRVGGQAFVTVAAMPDKPVRGTIAAILPLVDSITRAGRAVIRIRGNGVLRPGMYSDVKLEANRLPNRIIVPKVAIVERDNRPLVFTVKEGRAEWVYVMVGRSNDHETEILPDSATGTIPLKAGDIVLTSGHLTLTHQAPVKLIAKQMDDH